VRTEFETWLLQTPIFDLSAGVSHTTLSPARWAHELVEKLIGDGLLRCEDGVLRLAPPVA